jgi:hypothetical protein
MARASGIFGTPVTTISLAAFADSSAVVSFPLLFGHPAFRTCFFRHILSPLKNLNAVPNLIRSKNRSTGPMKRIRLPPIEVEINLSGANHDCPIYSTTLTD